MSKRIFSLLLVSIVASCSTRRQLHPLGSGAEQPITPSSWLVPAWFVDPQNSSSTASDNNNCTSSVTACLTFGEILIHRLGTLEPTFQQITTFTLLSPQSIGQDPIFFYPNLSNGGQANIIGTLTLITGGGSVIVGTVTPKNRSTPQLLTVAGMPAATIKNNFVCNATRSNSCAFVDSIAGGVATMQQPLSAASYVIPTTGLPVITEDNTWTTGDTINVYNLPPLINLEAWRPKGSDITSGGVYPYGWIQNITIADTSASGLSAFILLNDSTMVLSGCVANTRVNLSSLGGRGDPPYAIGDSFTQLLLTPVGSQSAQPSVLGGASINGIQDGSAIRMDDDFIIHGSGQSFNGGTVIGSVYADGTLTLGNAGPTTATLLAVLWGPGGVTLDPGTVFWNGSGSSYTTTLLLKGTLAFGATTTGTFFTPSTGVWSTPIPITAANIDTNNGLQNAQTGAKFTFTN